MVYATAGLAVGRIKTSGTISGSSLTVNQGVTHSVIHSVEHTVIPGGGGDDDDQVPVDIPVDTPVHIPFVTASINPPPVNAFTPSRQPVPRLRSTSSTPRRMTSAALGSLKARCTTTLDSSHVQMSFPGGV